MAHRRKDIYKSLRKHLDRMPVGFPATRSGVELRILRRLFTPEEARVALAMTHRFEAVEPIGRRLKGNNFSMDRCRAVLEAMAHKGAILKKEKNGPTSYALVPFVVGMFEFQLARLTPEWYEDAARYFREAFGLAYLSTAVPQMRVIPVEQSINDTHHIATYDEIRQIIEEAGGKIGVAHCICRKGKDLTGDPCKMTRRREVCFGFRDYFDTYKRENWFREVTKQEALEILEASEKEGLVLQATNEQQPQAVCACCGCCCGVLNTLKNVPNRADFVAANYQARVDAEACVGCGLCADRCHMEAISIWEKKARVDPKKCIGCGVCVPACKKAGALCLEPKAIPVVPPETTEALYEAIMAGKGGLDRAKTAIRILRHMRLKDIRELINS